MQHRARQARLGQDADTAERDPERNGKEREKHTGRQHAKVREGLTHLHAVPMRPSADSNEEDDLEDLSSKIDDFVKSLSPQRDGDDDVRPHYQAQASHRLSDDEIEALPQTQALVAAYSALAAAGEYRWQDALEQGSTTS